jgi:hypothetical protein
MTLPSSSNQKGAPIAIAKPLNIQPRIRLTKGKGQPLTGHPILSFSCWSKLDGFQPMYPVLYGIFIKMPGLLKQN